jgi:peptide deformylase
MDFEVKEIVEVKDIPKFADVQDVPLDDPMKIYKLCRKMEVICEEQQGIGLSAVQVGIPLKLFLVKSDGTGDFAEKDKYGYFVNCDYQEVTEEHIASMEGCLSLRSPDGRTRIFHVERWKTVRVTGFKLVDIGQPKFNDIDKKLEVEEQGIVFQHEIDHQKGVLISDIGTEIALLG